MSSETVARCYYIVNEEENKDDYMSVIFGKKRKQRKLVKLCKRRKRNKKENPKYMCILCDKIYCRESWVNYHFKMSHVPVKNLVCPVTRCGKLFKFMKQYIDHTARLHEDEMCMHCEVGYDIYNVPSMHVNC